MAAVVVNDQFLLVADTLTDIRTTPASKRDTVRVFVANDSSAQTTWKLTYAPLGVADVAAHVLVPFENLSGPGSGVSKPITMEATDKLRARSPGANVSILVNGISEDV